MKRRFIVGILISTLSMGLGGCIFPSGNGVYNAKLYTTGSKAKGVVAMLPVAVNPRNQGGDVLPWSLREEFTEELVKKLSLSDRVFLIKHNVSNRIASDFYSPMPKAIPVEITSQFLPAEFVIATELIDHSTVSDALKNETVCASMRVRVFDIRHNRSTLVYQEIIEAKQPIPQSASDYSRYGWRTSHFESTPMGLMHGRLIREIVARVEGYVCANYS
ncbi:CT253 family lipoprotein [Chlamydiifrater volucris]|uniref:CT253 family lipoprotein n=1 Tax=Chlamydiifrater volucris TaxID=2681470 RepID=UPI001BD07328|nr:CT253 family lipoprotein [Chlamydiifrater volucris]